MAIVWVFGGLGTSSCVGVISTAQFCPTADSLLPELKSLEERNAAPVEHRRVVVDLRNG